jgi:hypothetical protein
MLESRYALVGSWRARLFKICEQKFHTFRLQVLHIENKVHTIEGLMEYIGSNAGCFRVGTLGMVNAMGSTIQLDIDVVKLLVIMSLKANLNAGNGHILPIIKAEATNLEERQFSYYLEQLFLEFGPED